MRTHMMVAAIALAAAACTAKTDDQAADTGAAMQADTGMAAMGHDSAAMAGMDKDMAATGGSGVPAGYMARTDKESQKITDAKYTMKDGRWNVQTGPPHIVYAAKDMASGTYTASATFDQLEAPAHPEAFGIFVGGQNLDGAGQKYTYLLVRGTGQVMVTQRDGAGTKPVMAWTDNAAVTKADASGKGTYKLAIKVGADSVRFMVNDTQVGAAPKSAVSTDGIVGMRINHNLHVAATPVTITKG
ncbi:MAG: hypothetical protein WKG32_14105 [Gemmatimonadaceae bacterium]